MNNDINFINQLTTDLTKNNYKLIYPCPEVSTNFDTEDLEDDSFYPLYTLNLQTILNGTPFSKSLLQAASFNDLWGRSIVNDAAFAAIATADSFGFLNHLALVVRL